MMWLWDAADLLGDVLLFPSGLVLYWLTSVLGRVDGNFQVNHSGLGAASPRLGA